LSNFFCFTFSSFIFRVSVSFCFKDFFCVLTITLSQALQTAAAKKPDLFFSFFQIRIFFIFAQEYQTFSSIIT